MTERWSNWAREQVCTPALRRRAANVADVRAAVAEAEAADIPLRVAGNGHSFSPLCVTDGLLLTLDGMSGILEVDTAAGTATVAAGTPLHVLGPLLRGHGLAQENLGDIDVQTLAGALSTATHGTGIAFPPLSSQVQGVELVCADGSVRTLQREDGDAFHAAQASIGALGVVTAVTLRVVPAFTLRSTEELWPLERVYEEALATARTNEHWELFTFPHSGIAVTHLMQRVDAPPAPANPMVEYGRRIVLGNHLFEGVCRFGRRFPSRIPSLNRVVTKLALEPERVDESHKVFANPRRVRFVEMEIAVAAEHGTEALRRAIEIAERQTPAISFPIQLRYAAADEALVGPAHGRETAYVAVHVFTGLPWENYFREVAAALDELGGRPHWGKRHFHDASSLPDIHPGWDRFQAVRAALDPGGRFTTPAIAELLGPVGG